MTTFRRSDDLNTIGSTLQMTGAVTEKAMTIYFQDILMVRSSFQIIGAAMGKPCLSLFLGTAYKPPQQRTLTLVADS